LWKEEKKEEESEKEMGKGELEACAGRLRGGEGAGPGRARDETGGTYY
jgi:hypothetical protein